MAHGNFLRCAEWKFLQLRGLPQKDFWTCFDTYGDTGVVALPPALDLTFSPRARPTEDPCIPRPLRATLGAKGDMFFEVRAQHGPSLGWFCSSSCDEFGKIRAAMGRGRTSQVPTANLEVGSFSMQPGSHEHGINYTAL